MSKAVAIIDMPESCTKCEFAQSDNKDWFCSRCKKDNDDYVLRGTKPYWCPLRPLPNPCRITWASGYKKEYVDAYRKGWNDCLEEITGSSKEGDKHV